MPDRTCPAPLLDGPRRGTRCGRPARLDGFCSDHGPGGTLERRAREARDARGLCEHILERGPHAGAACGRGALPGKSVCARHDPGTIVNPRANSGQCKAMISGGARQCANHAVSGLDVCRQHGGSTPEAKAYSKGYVAELEARRELARQGVDTGVVTNALVAFQHHVGKMIAWRDYCEEMVTALSADDMRYASDQKLEQIRGEVQMYQRALQDTSAGLAALARVQVDERLAKIEAVKAAALVSILTATLLGSGMPPDQANAVRTDFAKRLRAITAPENPGEQAA